MYAIVTHGGAGDWKAKQARVVLLGMRRAAAAGANILRAGGSALDAVAVAVVALEDNPLFNAGTGSCLNIEGEAEMDASVMVGEGLAGAVAGIRRVKNPVLVARKVMEETDHVLLSGEGAERFARALDFADYDPVTPERLADYRKKYVHLRNRGYPGLPRLQQLLRRYSELAQGTVGAVALDAKGRTAAATSTGGMTFKLAGRIGDSPVPGAGNYATPRCAASATGQGELIMRCLATKTVCDRVLAGRTAQQAVEQIVAEIQQQLGGEMGLIALDAEGQIGIAHSTASMPHAYAREGQPEIVAGMRVNG